MTKNETTKPLPLNERVLAKLKESELYKTYHDAFLHATGLPLSLEIADDEGWMPCQGNENANKFCQLLNSKSACDQCALACGTLSRDADDHVETLQCFAGLSETVVPVRSGAQTIAFLSTGQVFHEVPGDKTFSKIRDLLAAEGRSEKELRLLEDAYLDSAVINLEQYRGITTLLAAFSLQLSGLASNLALEEESEPEPVRLAKQYINANLDDKVTLDEVAEHVHVSTFYFCKIFKATTGMTLTEYVNRRRVERAKHMLRNPDLRITEIAYEVGYQSLSQFNRSFLKYAGSSPSDFRHTQCTGQGMLTC